MKIEQEVLDLIIKFSKIMYNEGFYQDPYSNYIPLKDEDILEEFTEFVFVENKQLF